MKTVTLNDSQPQHTEVSRQPMLSLDVHSLWSALYRSRYWITAILVSSVLAGAVATLMMTPLYSASTSLQIDQGAIKVTGTEETEASAEIQDADRFLQTQVDIIGSRALADMVARSQGYYRDDKFLTRMKITPEYEGASPDQIRTKRKEMIVDILIDNLDVNLPLDSRVVRINFESPDPRLAAEVANSYADNFVRNNLQRKVDKSIYARDFLAEQLDEARARLAESEGQANNYSERARIIKTATDKEGTTLSTLTGESLQQLNSDLNIAAARRITAAKDWSSIASLPLMSIPQVNSNQVIQRLAEERGKAQAALDAERAKHLPAHPSVRQLQAQVNQLSRQINAIATNIRAGLKAPYLSALEAEKELIGRLNGLKNEQLREQRASVQLGILDRESQTNRAQYDALLARYNALNAEAGAQTSNLSIIDKADVPRKPIKPRPLVNVLLASIGGLALSLLFIFAREFVVGRLHSPEDIEKRIGLPLLGITPDTGNDDLLKMLNEPKSPISEAYAAIRSMLSMSSSHGLPRSLVFTSATQGEGKSISSYALAVATARQGKKVLLVDADLRRPRQHKLFGKPNKLGLSAVLTGNAEINKLIYRDEASGLDVLFSGALPPNPSELLAPETFGPIINEYMSDYDHVFIDAPPVLGLADAIEIAGAAEKIVFVVKSGQNNPSVVTKALSRLRLSKARIAGIILSKFDAKKSGYSARYGYNFQYGE